MRRRDADAATRSGCGGRRARARRPPSCGKAGRARPRPVRAWSPWRGAIRRPRPAGATLLRQLLDRAGGRHPSPFTIRTHSIPCLAPDFHRRWCGRRERNGRARHGRRRALPHRSPPPGHRTPRRLHPLAAQNGGKGPPLSGQPATQGGFRQRQTTRDLGRRPVDVESAAHDPRDPLCHRHAEQRARRRFVVQQGQEFGEACRAYRGAGRSLADGASGMDRRFDETRRQGGGDARRCRGRCDVARADVGDRVGLDLEHQRLMKPGALVRLVDDVEVGLARQNEELPGGEPRGGIAQPHLLGAGEHDAENRPVQPNRRQSLARQRAVGEEPRRVRQPPRNPFAAKRRRGRRAGRHGERRSAEIDRSCP